MFKDKRIVISFEVVLRLIDGLIIRLNRGMSFNIAIDSLKKLNYPEHIFQEFEKVYNDSPITNIDRKKFTRSDFFFILLELLRQTREWLPEEICDSLIILKHRIGNFIYTGSNPYEEPTYDYKRNIELFVNQAMSIVKK
jgi:hypothetical protein